MKNGKMMDGTLTRFLTMGPQALIERYSGEKEHLVTLHAGTIQWAIPEVVVIDNSKQHLPITAIPSQIAGKAEAILREIGHSFYDSATIRLNGLQNNGNRVTLSVAKAHYLHYVATNYSMDAFLKEEGWTRSLRDIVHPTPHLCQLEESLLCNHIGVGGLIFTRDNYLVLPVRAKKNVALWQQTISPSISGAMSYDNDLWNAKAGPVAGWIREGHEELGLDHKDFVEGSEIFLGLTRDLLRGGKPEMFFAAQIHLTRTQLEQKFSTTKDRWENKELQWFACSTPFTAHPTKREQATFLQEFSDFVSAYQGRLSRPMQVNIALWFNYLQKNDE